MKASIVLLPGDGIGPEVVREAKRVLSAVEERFGHTFEYEEHDIGGVAMDRTGDPLPETTLDACKHAHAVLLGAVGGPKWDDPTATVRPEQGLLRIRKELGLYANVRPVRPYAALAHASPIRAERLAGTDLVIVRELTGGLYFGERGTSDGADGVRAFDTLVYSETEIVRIVRLAFELARSRKKRVVSIDKANVLETSRLWRRVTTNVARAYPDVALEHQLVDAAAMRLVTSPASFDVIVTENMFGDILSDEASALAGSLGLLPSASLGDGKRGLYEPIHGSAPDIAGTGTANPIGTILSAAMLLRHTLGLAAEANVVECAVADVIAAGIWPRDLGPQAKATTRNVGDAIRDRVARGDPSVP
jgi:3-isopropylmalate dehydrogenase